MKKQINISVAIAVYNKEEKLLSTLNSIFAQTYPASEILIVNDGSTDASEAIIKSLSDPRIKYVYQNNKGASAARNKAITACSHEYIALIDADDLWKPTYLEEITKAIAQYPEQKVFASAIQTENKRGVSAPAKYKIPRLDKTQVYNYFEASKLHSLLHSSSILLHKSVFEEVGLFDPHILSGEDTDLWVRIGLKYPIVFVPKVLVTYTYAPKGLYQTKIPLEHRFSFAKFADQEKTNPALKHFLDLNRFALAIYAKQIGDLKNYKLLKNNINKQNLRLKKRILLRFPAWLIRILKALK